MPRKKQPRKTSKSGRPVPQKQVRSRSLPQRKPAQTGSKASGAAWKRNEQLLECLSAAALAAQNCLTPDELFAVMSKVLQRIGLQSTVFIMDQGRSSLVVKYLSYSGKLLAAGKLITGIEPEGYRVPVRAVKEYRKAIQNQSAVFIGDARDFLKRFLPKQAARFSEKVSRLLGVKQFIIAPLVSEGHVFGLLTVQSNTLTESDTPAVNVFASQLASVWSRAELFEEAQEEIARRRETEAFLIEERDRFRSTLDIAGVILLALNAAGNIMLINRKGQDILGYDKMNLMGKNWFDTCLPQGSRKEVKAIFRNLVSGKGGLSEYAENKIVTRTGEERIIAWHNTILRGAGGKITGTLSSGEDITERKKIEQALSSSEKKFKTLVESVHDVVFTLDLRQKHTGVFGLSLARSGMPSAAFIGKTAREILGDEAGAIHEVANLRALNGKQVVYDWSVPGPEGITYFQTSLSPLRDAGGHVTGLVGVGRDVTVQKRNERLIRLQRDLVRDLGNVSSPEEGAKRCLKTALDVTGMDSGSIYLFDSGSGALHLIHQRGFSPEFVRTVSQYEVRSSQAQLVLKGKPVYTENVKMDLKRDPVGIKEGLRTIGVIPIHHEGHVIGCLNVSSHSSDTVPHFERESLETIAAEVGRSIVGMQMKAALEKSKEKYKTLIETTREWIWSIDLKGKHTYCNPGFEKILGYAPGEILGKNSLNFIHPDDRSRVRALLKEKSTERDGWSELVLRWMHKDGSYRYLESNAVPMMDSKGVLIGYQGADRDITERKRAEEALLQSETRFRDLTENTSDWIWEVDAQMRYVYASPKIIQLLGYTPKEALGKTPSEFMPSAEAARMGKVLRDLKQKPRSFHNLENVNVCKDGSLRVLETSGVPIYNQEGRLTGFRGIDRDITERKRSEKSLQESEMKFRALVENSIIGIGISRENRIVYANRSLMHMYGQTDFNEFASKPMYEYLTPRSQAYLQQWRQKKNRGESVPMEMELDIVRKEGEVRMLRLSMTYVTIDNDTHVYSTFNDITEYKRAEEALKQSESKYRSMVLAAPIGVGVVVNRVFEEVNESLCAMTGYSREELLDRSSQIVYPDEEEFLRVGKVKYAEIREKGVGHIEMRWKRKDGEIRDIFLSSAMIDTNDPLKGTAFTALDITERKRAEIVLKESEEKFRTVIEQASEGICLLDEKGRVIEWNRGMERIWGLSKNQVAERPFHEILYQASLPKERGSERKDYYHNVILEALRTGKSSLFNHPIEADISKPDGEIRTIQQIIFPIRTDRGFRIASVTSDITERKRAEKSLQESEMRYRALVENSLIGIGISQGNRIVYANRSLMTIYGYTDFSELASKPLLDYLTPQSQAVIREWGQKSDRGEPVPMEMELDIMRKDGGVRTLQLSMAHVTIDKENYIYSTFIDVTERKRTEEALKESELQYRTTIDSMGDAIQVMDGNMRLVLFNKAFQDWHRRLGLSTEVIGKELYEVFPFLPESVRDEYDSVFRSGEMLLTQESMQLGGQDIFTESRKIPVIKDKQVIQVITVATDVTERKSAERALRRSEELFRQLAENIHEVFWVRDFKTRRIEYVSPAFEEVWGRPCRSMYEDPELFIKTIHPDDLSRIGGAIEAQRRTGVVDEQYRIIRPDRTIRWVRARTYPVKDARGGVYRAVGVAEDVTDFKHAEETLKKSRDAFRLASLGTLAAGISHEINQPLTALKVKVDGMLYWGTENPDLLQKNLVPNLTFISDEAEKIDHIIQHMRSLIRREKQEPEPVDLNAVIQRALTLMGQQMASHGIRLELDLDPAKPVVVAQEVSLEEVVVNLLSNAVHILDTVDQDVKTVRIATRMQADACVLVVEDNGPGIPDAHRERIFDPLFTTREKGTGMGLGLSIVQRLLEEYRGSIRASNRAEGGAAFTVELPLSGTDRQSAS
jgi:PAS domain S-box-containing protein